MFEFLKLFMAILCDQCGWTSEMVVTGVTEIDSAIPEYWAAGIMKDGNRESFWGSLSGGENSRMPIIDKTGPLKQKGDQLTFNVIAQLMGSGVTGESVLKGKEEKLSVGSFTVTADVIRHAVAVTRKSTQQANFEEVKSAGELLKDWASRKLDYDVFNTVLGNANIRTLYANGKTSVNQLASNSEAFGPSEIGKLRLALQRVGAQPLKTTKVNGRSIPLYGCVFGEVEEYRLYQNTTFTATIRETLARVKGNMGGDHPLLSGAMGVYRNMILYPYYSILDLPQGTALRPETAVYGTLVTAATTITVGSSATPNYTLNFASSGTLQIGSEIITYTGKTNNTFTGCTRGASGSSAAQYSEDTLITQGNVSSVIGFGAEMMCRAMPNNWETIGEKDDYGEQIGLGIRGYYGHALKTSQRQSSKPTGCVVLKCYSENPGTV